MQRPVILDSSCLFTYVDYALYSSMELREMDSQSRERNDKYLLDGRYGVTRVVNRAMEWNVEQAHASPADVIFYLRKMMAHVNQGQGIGDAGDFLTRFHNISNKLKK